MNSTIEMRTIGDILVNLGIFPNIDSFSYLQDAVEYINELPGNNVDINVVDIYSHIASKYSGKQWTNIERAIRHASTVIYDNPTSLVEEIFGKYRSYSSGKISSGQLMFALAFYCKKHHLERYSNAYISKNQLRLQYIDRFLAEHYPEYEEELKKCES